jgi:hypothetical protein
MAADCTDIHLPGTAQSISFGTASINFIPGIGTDVYRAIFARTTSAGASVSGIAVLAVS